MTPPAGALDIDEIRRLIQTAFLDPDQEAELLSLRAEDAQRALDEMWKVSIYVPQIPIHSDRNPPAVS